MELSASKWEVFVSYIISFHKPFTGGLGDLQQLNESIRVRSLWYTSTSFQFPTIPRRVYVPFENRSVTDNNVEVTIVSHFQISSKYLENTNNKKVLSLLESTCPIRCKENTRKDMRTNGGIFYSYITSISPWNNI